MTCVWTRFDPKRYENGDLRKLHNEKFHMLHPSPNIVRMIKSRRIRWPGHVAKMEEGRCAWCVFKILTSESTRKIPLGRPRRRWEENIRMDVKEIGINTMNWINSAQDREYGNPLFTRH